MTGTVSGGSGIPILDDSELEFEVPRGCPNATSFLEQTNRRGQSSRPFRVDAAFRDVRVHIEKTQAGAEGVLRIRESVGHFSERRVSAPACSEVVTALALVTSVALEGEQSRDEDLVSHPPSRDHDGKTARASLHRGIVATPRPLRRRKTLRQPATAPVAPANDSSSIGASDAMDQSPMADYRESDAVTSFFGPRTPYGWWALGAHGGFVSGALPETLPTAELFVDARFDPTVTWNPSFRLSAKRAVQDGSTSASTKTWTAGRADACLVNVQLDHDVAFWPCATFDAALTTGTDPYISFGGLARLQWIVFDVLLLEAQSGASLGGTSTRPGATLHASAGIGARFP